MDLVAIRHVLRFRLNLEGTQNLCTDPVVYLYVHIINRCLPSQYRIEAHPYGRADGEFWRTSRVLFGRRALHPHGTRCFPIVRSFTIYRDTHHGVGHTWQRQFVRAAKKNQSLTSWSPKPKHVRFFKRSVVVVIPIGGKRPLFFQSLW